MKTDIKSTTIIGVRHKRKVAMAGDGQITFGDMAFKQKAVKVREFSTEKDGVLGGFAGAAADALTLFEKFEQKLDQYEGDLKRSVVELAKEWRTDRFLRRLESVLLVADQKHTLMVSGQGDVIEPDDGVAGIGSGGGFAVSAARALCGHSSLDCREIVERSLLIASELCIYTNDKIHVEEL